MTVLMIGPHPEARGGIASVLAMYGEAGFFKKRHKRMASTTDGSIARRILWFMGFLPLYVARLILDWSIDIVHIHLAVRASVARKAVVFYLARALGRRTILHFHGAQFKVFYGNSPGWIRRLITRMFQDADRVICLNHTCRRHIEELVGVSPVVIYNPTRLQTPVRQGNDPVRFLFMGRIGQRKGVFDLIEAARHIDFTHARIHIYGDGEVEKARDLVMSYRLSQHVHVHGWISGEEKDDVFRSCQVLVLPSYNEGLPISVLEALAYGMPVIATPVGGIPDAVQDGWNGILVRPGDAYALACAINRLAADQSLREAMGEAGYERARQRFEVHTILETLEETYRSLNAPWEGAAPA